MPNRIPEIKQLKRGDDLNSQQLLYLRKSSHIEDDSLENIEDLGNKLDALVTSISELSTLIREFVNVVNLVVDIEDKRLRVKVGGRLPSNGNNIRNDVNDNG